MDLIRFDQFNIETREITKNKHGCSKLKTDRDEKIQFMKCNTPPAKRNRITFNHNQLYEMEFVFKKTHYPDIMTRQKLACLCNLSEERVQVIINIIL
ncbi:hypothetical protein A3Q56_08061 [Intoshia linei]|uniref:Homeobox domain-containing protein n=1 Tax=Intoshia linei TaxID=1819745 RepID=A0A177AQH0_9BILA|nr:hypothetical protein A3Q56_08061 [Intoshia linei]